MGWPRLTLESAITTDPGQTPVWEDITEWWAGDAGTRASLCGRQTELDRFNDASLTVALDNTTRRFDPTNTAGPYYGNLRPMRRIRIRAGWNLLPTVDDTVFTISSAGSWAALANCSISTTLASGTGSPNTLCLLLTKTGGSPPISAISAAMAADPGTPYAASAYLRVVSGVLPTAGRIKLVFYAGPAGTGATLATVVSADVSTSTSGLWLLATVATVSPAGTQSMRLIVEGDTATNTNTFGAAAPGVYQADTAPAYSSAVLADLINGYVERWPLEYAGPDDAWVPVSGTGAFKVLNLLDLPASVYDLEADADNPAHGWTLSDPVGSLTLADSSTPAVNGTVVQRAVGTPPVNIVTLGAASLTAGVSATAMAVDPIASGIITYVARFPAGPSGDFTIEYVCQYTGSDDITPVTILTSSGASAAGIQLSQSLGETLFGIGPIVTTVYKPDTAVHHYAFKRSGTTFTAYVDGNSFGSTVSAGWDLTGSIVVAAPASNGALTIQNVKLYSSALSDARVAAHARGALGTAYAGDTTGARVGRYLDMTGWPTADRNIDAGNSTVQAAAALGQAALAALQQVEETEAGKLFVTADNKVRFMGRRSVYTNTRSSTSQATFSDAGPLDYESITFGYDDAEIRNDVRVTRQGGLEQQATDATSQGRYYARTYSPSQAPLYQTDPESADLAGWLLARFKDPLVRIDSITIAPYGNDAYWPLILTLGVGDRITIVRTPPGGGSAISIDALIEGVAHDFDRERWTTTYQLSQAETAFVLHGYGSFVLGTDVLAF